MEKRIKELRKSLHMNQTEFGERIGVKTNTLANYELGNRNPSNAVILAICREFNVDETWLRTGEGEMFRDDDEALYGMADKIADEMERSDVFRAIIRIFLTLPQSDRDVIEHFIDALTDEKRNPAHSVPDFEELMRRAQEEPTEDTAE